MLTDGGRTYCATGIVEGRVLVARHRRCTRFEVSPRVIASFNGPTRSVSVFRAAELLAVKLEI